jgi:hypothetical protein
MTHYWLTDRNDGLQYIYNPGQPDHGSCSYDGINWDRPVDDAHLAQRQIIMDGIMARAKHDWDATTARQRERERLAAQQDGTLANHIGNMETPEAAAERERQKQNLKAIKAIRKELDRTTIGEHMMSVLGCALFAVCIAGGTMFVVLCIDAILKTVRAW